MWDGLQIVDDTGVFDDRLTLFGLAGGARVHENILANVRDDGGSLLLVLVDLAAVLETGFIDPVVPDLAAQAFFSAPIHNVGGQDAFAIAFSDDGTRLAVASGPRAIVQPPRLFLIYADNEAQPVRALIDRTVPARSIAVDGDRVVVLEGTRVSLLEPSGQDLVEIDFVDVLDASHILAFDGNNVLVSAQSGLRFFNATLDEIGALSLPETPISFVADADRLLVATPSDLFVVSPPCPPP